MRSPIKLTHYCPWVYSNELGAFIPLLISWAIELTITNIFYDDPLVCGYQLHHEDMSTKFEKIQLLQNWSLQVGAAREILSFLNLDDGMDEEVGKKRLYIFRIYMCENLNFQFGVHTTTLEVIKVQRPDDECLTQWAWMSIWNNFSLRCYPHYQRWLILTIDHTPGMKNLLPPSSLSITFYEVPNSFGAFFFFKLKRSWMSLAPICS